MSTIGFQPGTFFWKDTIDTAYRNLSSKASNIVVHFAIDMKYVMDWLDKRNLNIKNGLLLDQLLELEVRKAYPEEDREYLYGYLFFRDFLIDTDKTDEIEDWIFNQFHEMPDYIWVNGEMKGGLCFPQLHSSENEYPPLIEHLPLTVQYKPKVRILE